LEASLKNLNKNKAGPKMTNILKTFRRSLSKFCGKMPDFIYDGGSLILEGMLKQAR